jgi:hypothetical protein
MNSRIRRGLVLAVVVILGVAVPASALDYPLTPEAIRDAYTYARGPHGLDAEFLPDYTHALPELKAGPNYASWIKIETPYLQVAEYARGVSASDYDHQELEEKFLHKPLRVRVVLDI